jgi:hypothetical protein
VCVCARAHTGIINTIIALTLPLLPPPPLSRAVHAMRLPYPRDALLAAAGSRVD